MDDFSNAGKFLLIFALALVLYGAVLAKTGNKELMPYRAVHSIRGADDVKRVGRIVIIVGLVLAALVLVGLAVWGLAKRG